MNKENPLSPHIQIYSWNISSLISISHRIVGVINIQILVLVCLWIALLALGETNYLIWLMQQKNGYFLKLVQ